MESSESISLERDDSAKHPLIGWPIKKDRSAVLFAIEAVLLRQLRRWAVRNL